MLLHAVSHERAVEIRKPTSVPRHPHPKFVIFAASIAAILVASGVKEFCAAGHDSRVSKRIESSHGRDNCRVLAGILPSADDQAVAIDDDGLRSEHIDIRLP